MPAHRYRKAPTGYCPRFLAGGLLLAVCLLASGCLLTLSPPEHRARQYSTEFSAYPDDVQTRLRAATIAIGDDRTAVYIALGKPQASRIGYDRSEETGDVINIEFWEYSGYPTGEAEGQFVTLNNGGFAAPFSMTPYGKLVVRFADARVCEYSYDPTQDASGNGGSQMMVPPDPHK